MNKKKRRLRAILIALLVPVLGFIGTVIVLGMQRAMRYEAPEIEQAGQAVHAVPTPTPKPKPSPGSTAARPALSETLNLLMRNPAAMRTASSSRRSTRTPGS